MKYFPIRGERQYCEDLPVKDLADQFGTPLYVYSRLAIEQNFLAYQQALAEHPGLICYAVKANGNIAVLNLLARLGSGFDIVSQGELKRVLAAGGDPKKVVFSGVAKSEQEMRFALEHDIHCFNVESRAELVELNRVAESLGRRAPVSIRVNPNVDAKTHPYISTGSSHNKFGIDINEVESLYLYAQQDLKHLDLVGVDCHIGSQITDDEPLREAMRHILALVDRLAEHGVVLKHVDLGGGIGIAYTSKDQPPAISDYVEHVKAEMGKRDLALILEPGRSIVGDAGMLLTRVRYIKPTEAKNFCIIDAAMNDMARPALYQAWMNISEAEPCSVPAASYDVVGPICETGDFLGKDRSLRVSPGDVLCVHHAGAYGFSMSSNYNARARAAEVLVDGDHAHLIRERELEEELFAKEKVIS